MWSGGIPKKIFPTFDNDFHVHLMRGLQKYAGILIVEGRPKKRSSCRLAGLGVIFGVSISCIFLQLELDTLSNVGNT